MISYSHNLSLRFLLLLLLAFVLAPMNASPSGLPFVGCYDKFQHIGNPHASVNMFRVPLDKLGRFQACVHFCTTGIPPENAEPPHTAEGGFPHRYIGFNDPWCFCGGQLKAKPVPGKMDPNQCGQLIAVYTRGGAVQPPPPFQANRPPWAPTILSPTTASSNSNVWTAIPANPATGIFLRWRNSGDPDNDPLRFWIAIARWDGAKWEQVYAGYAPDKYATDGSMVFTMTSQHGLANRSYYHWYVIAVDTNNRNQTVSQPGRFRTN